MTALFELAARLQSADAAEGMLWMIAKATLILIIARLLLAAMPRAAAATKHLVATAALIAVAMMPIFSVVVPAWNLRIQARAKAEAATQPPAASRQPSTQQPIGLSDAEPIATAISVAKATGIADKPLTLLDRSTKLVRSTWKGMFVVAVGTATLLMLGHMLLGMLGVWVVALRGEEVTNETMLRELDAAHDRLALKRDVRLLLSPRVAVPVLWGMFRPVLLLPADAESWPAERLRVVLLHELAHLARWDGVSLILTRIALSLFWFHPLAWSLERAGRSECERACDDLVLASGTKPSEYADHLLAIARSMPAFDPFRSVTLAMSRKTQLEGRLLSILQRDVARRVFSGRGVAIACALAVAVIVPISAVRLIATPSEEKAKPATIQEDVAQKKTDSEVDVDASSDVNDDVSAIGDYLLAKLGKYDKRADRWMREPRDGEDWYDRAYDLYRNDRYAEAAAAFHKAADARFRKDTSLYNAACAYALLGDADHAMKDLSAAIDAGWDDFDHIADDSDFDPIRTDPRFARLLDSRHADLSTRRVREASEKFDELRSEGVSKHNGDEWFDTGLDLLRLRKLDDSIAAFQNSIAADEKTASAMYNIACAYSYKHDANNGLAWLSKAVDNGFSDDDKFASDPDLAWLRNESGFDAIRDKARDLEMRGCCDGPVIGHLFDNWKESEEHHQKMVRKYPDSGRAWFNLGYTALQARDFGTATDAFNRAIAFHYRVGTSSYNVACAYALQKNADAAFTWLDRAKTAGFDLDDHLEDDDDLNYLHRDARWDTLVR